MDIISDYLKKADERDKYERTETERKMAAFRKENEEFDSLVAEITQKIEKQIEETSNIRSFNPKDSRYYKVHMKVKAVPITLEEKKCLLQYLNEKYINKVAGHYFELKKCWLSEQYLVRTAWCD